MVTLNNKHTANAQVGKDTIENAEYFEFNYNTETKEKSFKDKLEDIWLNICWPFRKIKWWIRDIYWEIRYAFQRAIRGYDYVDTFETFAKFTERYEKILKDYKKHHYGYPGDMSVEKWESIVDDMIYHLHYMDEQNVEDELSKKMPEDWVPSSITVYEIMERHKDEFFKLFSKYFYNLWD
jgi:hypothetical protein